LHQRYKVYVKPITIRTVHKFYAISRDNQIGQRDGAAKTEAIPTTKMSGIAAENASGHTVVARAAGVNNKAVLNRSVAYISSDRAVVKTIHTDASNWLYVVRLLLGDVGHRIISD
jgi:hypothetical protein